MVKYVELQQYPDTNTLPVDTLPVDTPTEPINTPPGSQEDTRDINKPEPYRFDAMSELDMIDPYIADKVGSFPTIAIPNSSGNKSKLSSKEGSLNNAYANMISMQEGQTQAVKEVGAGSLNTLQTALEHVYYQTQMSALRTGAVLFGDTTVAVRRGPYDEEIMYGGDKPSFMRKAADLVLPGFGIFSNQMARTSVGKYARDLMWAWRDNVEQAMEDVRMERGYRPEDISSQVGEATGSILGSMGLAFLFKGAGLAVGATPQLATNFASAGTIASFAASSGLNEMDDNLAKGSTVPEALAYGAVQSVITGYSESLGLKWIFKEHSSKMARMADAIFGETFENWVESAGSYTLAEAKAFFEDRVIKENGWRTDTIFGERLIRSWDDFENIAKAQMIATGVTFLSAGTVNLAFGSVTNQFMRAGLNRSLNVTDADAQKISEEAIARLEVQLAQDISTEEGVDYDKVQYVSRSIDKALERVSPAVPSTIMDEQKQATLEEEAKTVREPTVGLDNNLELSGRLNRLREEERKLRADMNSVQAKVDGKLEQQAMKDAIAGEKLEKAYDEGKIKEITTETVESPVEKEEPEKKKAKPDTLIEEAKKYDSEEEFVASRKSVKSKATITKLDPLSEKEGMKVVIADIDKMLSEEWYGNKPTEGTITKLPFGSDKFPNKYLKAKDFIKNTKGNEIEMPYITGFLKDGKIQNLEGKHRFLVFKDMGAKEIAIAVPKDTNISEHGWIMSERPKHLTDIWNKAQEDVTVEEPETISPLEKKLQKAVDRWVENRMEQIQIESGETTELDPATKRVVLPANRIQSVKRRLADKVIAEYRRGVKSGRKFTKFEIKAVQKVMREYIKSAKDISDNVRLRLMNSITGIQTEGNLVKRMSEVKRQLDLDIRKQVGRAYREGITELLKRLKKKAANNAIDVETKKFINRVDRIRKDPGVRHDILNRALNEGILPGTTEALETVVARYFNAGTIEDNVELGNVFDALSTVYSQGVTEYNRKRATQQKKREDLINKVIEEIRAESETGNKADRRKYFLSKVLQYTGVEYALNTHTLLRAIDKSNDPNGVIKAIDLSGAEMIQQAYESKSRQDLREVYKRAYSLSTDAEVQAQVRLDAKEFERDILVPIKEKLGIRRDENGNEVTVLGDNFITINKAQARTIWAYWQNEKSKKALLKKGITEETFDAIDTNIMTQEDVDFVYGYQDVMYELYKKVQPIYERLTNKTLGFEDFYLPLATMDTREGEGISAVEQMLAGDRQSLLNVGPLPSAVRQKTGGGEAKIVEDVHLIHKYIRDMAHFIGTAEQAKLANDIFTDSRVREAIIERYGETRYRALSVGINAFTRNSIYQAHKDLYGAWGSLSDSMVSFFILAGSPKIGVRQLISSINAITEVPISSFIEGWESLPSAFATGEIKELMRHPYFKERGFSNYDALLKSMLYPRTGSEGAQPYKLNIRQFLGAAVSAGDKAGLLANTWVLYKHYQKTMPKPEALNAAFKVSNTNQQSPFISQVPVGALQTNGFMRGFYAFTSAPLQYLNICYGAAAEYAGQDLKGKSRLDIIAALSVGPEAKKFALSMAVFWVLNPLLYRWMADNFSSSKKELAVAGAMGPYANVPVTGQLTLGILELGLLHASAYLEDEKVNLFSEMMLKSRLQDEMVQIAAIKGAVSLISKVSDIAMDIEEVEAKEWLDIMKLGGMVAAPVSPELGALISVGAGIGQAGVSAAEGEYNQIVPRLLQFSTYVIEKGEEGEYNE